ncbi:MAG: hypothetical protein A2Z20_11730 [Bdellovibrionales bacterium RBG_16_40_8]|nr:MAG: hypothetical protein A2Z20_11730 [Bdellovibrionales bacterium RBG_16_40_8]
MIKKDQCAKFWSGDECIYYKLPAGWKETYPDDKGFINYREKKCKFEAGKEKNCCEQLGLKFVDTKADKDLSQAAPDFCKDR